MHGPITLEVRIYTLFCIINTLLVGNSRILVYVGITDARKPLTDKPSQSGSKLKPINMTETFLPWLDKLEKLDMDGLGDQEWIQKTKKRIEQKESYSELNKGLYECVSSVSVNNLASNKLRLGY